MKLNENTAISTPKVLLVPYDRRHVSRYHEWMKDPVIQEATASEPLSLAEEYENQASWRASHDKLTFILCQPSPPATAAAAVNADQVDAPERMVGDINFFLYPSEDDDDDGVVVGEVDIMIAALEHRGKGLGRAAVEAFLYWILRHRGEILEEYCTGEEKRTAGGKGLVLRMLMAKIKAGNVGSIALFRGLGFVQEGEVNYFGEIKMVLREEGFKMAGLEEEPVGYRVVEYCRAMN
ncbi:unnamed protein product [Discula destructiva]